MCPTGRRRIKGHGRTLVCSAGNLTTSMVIPCGWSSVSDIKEFKYKFNVRLCIPYAVAYRGLLSFYFTCLYSIDHDSIDTHHPQSPTMQQTTYCRRSTALFIAYYHSCIAVVVTCVCWVLYLADLSSASSTQALLFLGLARGLLFSN